MGKLFPHPRPVAVLHAALVCLLILGALIVFPLRLWAQEESLAPAVDSTPQVVHLKIRSVVHPTLAEHIADGLALADRLGATAVVIELDTPGGLLTSTREITQAMLGAKTPVVVFVGPQGAQAASAGFFLLMAADVAAMAPGTNTGAAHPVGGQGETIEGDLGDKVEQDAAATIRALAGQHGRNLELAEAAVVESRSFSAEEALDSGLIEWIADDLESLLARLDGYEGQKGETSFALATGEAQVVVHEMTPFRRFLAALAHPNIAYILMAFGWLGLYMEISNPGAIFPGVVGAICLILGFYALSVLPVSYAGVALLFLAMLLFLAELKIVSYGLLSVGGVISLVLGSLMLFKDAGPAMRLGGGLVATTAGTILLLVGLVMTQAIRMKNAPVTTGREGLLGEHGVVRTAVGEGADTAEGKVFVHGELWRATAAQPIAAGTEVEVVAMDGLVLEVRPHVVSHSAAEQG